MTVSELLAGKQIREITSCLREGIGCAAVYDLCDCQEALLCARAAADLGKKVLFVTSSWRRAERLFGDISSMTEGRALLLPAEEKLFVQGTRDSEGDERFLECMEKLCGDVTDVLVLSAESLLAPMTDRTLWKKSAVTFRSGDRGSPEEMGALFVRLGYEKREMVEGPMQCAVRGDILDLWPAGRKGALRVEFFGDEIDLVKVFDPVSQRSTERLNDEVTVYPASRWLTEDPAGADKMLGAVKTGIARLRQAGGEGYTGAETAPGLGAETEKIRDFMETGIYRGDLSKWSAFLPGECSGIWDWFDLEPLVLLDEPERISQAMSDRFESFREDLKNAVERGDALWEWQKALFDPEEALAALRRLQCLTLQQFLKGQGGLKPDRVFPLPGRPSAKYFSRVQDLVEDIRLWRRDHWRIFLCAGGETRQKRLQSTLSEYNIDLELFREDRLEGREGILRMTLSQGMVCDEEKLALISETDLFGSSRQGGSAGKKKKELHQKIDAFTDLSEGDLVVHENHGIGIYQGTVRLQSEGTWRDYFLIQYKGSDRLYVPVDQFDKVQKYIGGGGENPPELSSLGSDTWNRQRRKVRAGLQKLAFDLVKLYAKRQETPGFAFEKDTPWQAQFEDAFPYELTEDQETAVREIKEDMEKPVNMDRLLCGDVGFGKTEVALRAVFKCIMSGKQAAILCPTTILAQQHFYTIQQRFSSFPVKADVLSRFKSAKATGETLRDLKEGKIDIIVGTHKLLGKNVVFRDLGLLVVDEEQRFGVSHKEKIKNYKEQVDVLTLSATPIPRTLHMSMIGVRDMSLLTTPPEERRPVQTYVTDYSDSLVRDAVNREIARGGQVYFLYNHVHYINEFAGHLRNLLPGARVAVAHGQMPEGLLENVMLDFFDHKYDVLLCSTIIENGLDVADANTLIVYDADRYGLSQLYQLRGRVGRSSRTAFAYFTVRKDKMLSETAEKRLGAIREFTAFGSGFRVAMRDLEIRGSGNIFGPEQSGNVAVVGYDLYCKMIEEAVREMMPGGAPVRQETRVELKVDAFLPREYVRDDRQRMEVFKRISLIRNRADREDVIEELFDRFGEIPVSVLNLIDVAHLKALSSLLFVSRITSVKGLLSFFLEKCPDPQKLYTALEKSDPRLLLSVGNRPAILFRVTGMDTEELMKAAVPVLEKVTAYMFDAGGASLSPEAGGEGKI